jgi:tetratricopeptide (TPR) repeat protein
MIEDKKYYRAMVAYKKSIELDSTNANAYFKCALAYYGLADLTSARKYFNQAIDKNTNYSLARYQRSMLLIHMQQFGEAINDLNFILQKSPNDTNLIFLKCVALYHHGEYEDAISLFFQARRIAEIPSPS